MGLIFIPGQSIEFVLNGQDDFNTRNYKCKGDPKEFCQIVSYDYPTQFQIKLTPDTGEELLTNGDFDGDISGWTASGLGSWFYGTTIPGATGAIGAINIGKTSLTQSAAFAAEIGKGYIIDIDVCDYVPDGEGELYITIEDGSGNSAGVITGIGSDSNPINTDGTYSLFFESSYTGNVDFIINLETPPLGVSSPLLLAVVCSVSVKSVTLPTVSIQDCNGNEIDTIEDIEYADEYATVTVDWSPYPAGCYKICVFPEQDTGENLFGDLLCITDELGNPIVDQNDNCIQYPI